MVNIANPKGNIENLQPGNVNHTFTPEEVLKGNKKSIEVRHQKKTFTNAVKWLANANINIEKGKIKEAFESNNIDITGLDTTQLATIGLWLGSVYGNANNFRTLAEYNGEVDLDENFEPEIEEIEQIIDNSHLEGVIYEANRLNKDDETK